jgi:hypothetical protein
LIHATAYWLMHSLRDLAPKTSFWRYAQFDIIRLALIYGAACPNRSFLASRQTRRPAPTPPRRTAPNSR